MRSFSSWNRAFPRKAEFTSKYMMVAGVPMIGVGMRLRFMNIVRMDM